MDHTADLARAALVGIGATLVMDSWLALLRRAGIETLDFALIGRWVGHLARGRVAHAAIRKAAPVAGERALGWLAHYATGIAFAGALVAIEGTAWMRAPSLLPALAVGVGSVAAPFLVMQPAMGAGLAASKTPAPWRNRARSVANHAVFGLGLYVSAAVLAGVAS